MAARNFYLHFETANREGHRAGTLGQTIPALPDLTLLLCSRSNKKFLVTRRRNNTLFLVCIIFSHAVTQSFPELNKKGPGTRSNKFLSVLKEGTPRPSFL